MLFRSKFEKKNTIIRMKKSMRAIGIQISTIYTDLLLNLKKKTIGHKI